MFSHAGRPEAVGRRQCGKWLFYLNSERSELRCVNLFFLIVKSYPAKRVGSG